LRIAKTIDFTVELGKRSPPNRSSFSSPRSRVTGDSGRREGRCWKCFAAGQPKLHILLN